MRDDLPSTPEPEKRPPWRPTDYRAHMCEQVVELGAEGKSRVEIAVELGVGTTTLQRWEEAHPDFRVAMAHAKEREQVWWEKKGRDNLDAQHFQSSMWSRSMAARFPKDWREKTAVVGGDKDDNPIKQEHTHRNIDAVLSRVSGIAARIGEDRNPEGSD